MWNHVKDVYKRQDQEDNKWSAPFPSETLFESFSLAASDNAPTARSTKGPYEEKTSFVSIVDGFIVSDNITVESCENLDLGFAYTYHLQMPKLFNADVR